MARTLTFGEAGVIAEQAMDAESAALWVAHEARMDRYCAEARFDSARATLEGARRRGLHSEFIAECEADVEAARIEAELAADLDALRRHEAEQQRERAAGLDTQHTGPDGEPF